MANEKILLVDDEVAVTDMVKEWLEEGGYRVITAPDGAKGLKEFFNNQPDLAIVDMVMPGLDGFTLCQRIREVSQVPIIVLSARGHEVDKVRALQMGADEYLVKPIGGKELLARVGAALRRAKMAPAEEATAYSDAVISLDFKKHEAYVQGKQVLLTPTEYRLLAYLVQHPDRTVTQQELWDRVWAWDAGSLESVRWHISYLRRKIEEDPEQPKLVLTVRGIGYRYQKPTA